MVRLVCLLAIGLAGMAGSTNVAISASFDCSQAGTPFEQAICDNPELSTADDRLAATYETAVGGLSETARNAVRTGQREWLSYAQRACTRDARPLASGEYDERGLACLVNLFDGRSGVLEQSRMIDGLRFYPVARYEALPDPNEADNPDSWSPVARHELSWTQLDSDEGFAHAFNDVVRAEGERMSPVIAGTIGPDAEDDGSSSDTNNSLAIEEVAGTARISVKANTYWYGHGAAHGNWAIEYRHYLIQEGRWMEARDLFTGDGWEAALLDLAVKAAEAEHGDDLMLDDTSYIADAITKPERWIISDSYALIIQFQPYEISSYAYGAPQVRVRWHDLEPYLVEGSERIRFGY